jgi:hypothetical protein
MSSRISMGYRITMRCRISVCSHCSMHVPLAHKMDIAGDSNLDFVCSGDPDAILVGSAVSDHNSFETAVIQLFGLLLGHMDECLCADCNEMGNVGLLPIECLVGRHSVEGGSWAAILQMCNGTGDFGPELFQELGFGEDGAYPFTKFGWLVRQRRFVPERRGPSLRDGCPSRCTNPPSVCDILHRRGFESI